MAFALLSRAFSHSHPRGKVKLRVDAEIAFRPAFDDAIKMPACWKLSSANCCSVNFVWIALAFDMPDLALCCPRMMFTRTSYE